MTFSDLPTCWLTTVRPDGSPHTTPVWFVLEDGRDGDTIWVATSWSVVKIENLKGDDRVSVAIDGTGAAPAVAEGTARLHDLATAEGRAPQQAVLDRFAAKYDGWDAADPSQYGPRVLIEVALHRWLLGG